MPVGTRGAIKYLSAADYEQLGAEIVLGNTYHLMLRPGAETVAALRWPRPRSPGGTGLTLTDSGGFQVFSLEPEGRRRRRHVPARLRRLDAPLHAGVAVATQELLGADIQMVLDVCPPLPSPLDVVRTAVERTAAWAERARAAHRRDDQALFGIVQGGIDEAMRAEHAERTADARLRRLRHRRAVASGRPASRCCRRSPRRSSTCPPIGPGT